MQKRQTLHLPPNFLLHQNTWFCLPQPLFPSISFLGSLLFYTRLLTPFFHAAEVITSLPRPMALIWAVVKDRGSRRKTPRCHPIHWPPVKKTQLFWKVRTMPWKAPAFWLCPASCLPYWISQNHQQSERMSVILLGICTNSVGLWSFIHGFQILKHRSPSSAPFFFRKGHRCGPFQCERISSTPRGVAGRRLSWWNWKMKCIIYTLVN